MTIHGQYSSNVNEGSIVIKTKETIASSGCRRGGFLYEPANPPRKIVVRDIRGPAANYSRTTVIHIVKPTGQVEEPATTHKHQDSGTIVSVSRHRRSPQLRPSS